MASDVQALLRNFFGVFFISGQMFELIQNDGSKVLTRAIGPELSFLLYAVRKLHFEAGKVSKMF